MEAGKDSKWCRICEGKLEKLFSVPNLRTDTEFMSGADDGFNVDNASRQRAIAKARAAGVNVSGMKFHPGLCPPGEPLSPRAWYDGRGDVARKALALGRNVEGSVTVNAPVLDKDYADLERPYRPSRETVMDYVNADITHNHGGAVTYKKREELIEKHRDICAGNPTPKGTVKLSD